MPFVLQSFRFRIRDACAIQRCIATLVIRVAHTPPHHSASDVRNLMIVARLCMQYRNIHTHTYSRTQILVHVGQLAMAAPSIRSVTLPRAAPPTSYKVVLVICFTFFFFFSQACECGCVRVPTTGASHHAASSAASQSIGLFTCCRVLLHLHVRHGARTVRRDAKQGATMLARQLQLLQKLCLLGHYRLLRSLCSELLPYNICVYVTTTALAKSAIASCEFSQSLL